MLFTLKILFAAFGLTMPGHAAARMLGLRLRWAVAFPFSSLILTVVVMACAIAGIPIRLYTVAVVMCGFTLLCHWVASIRFNDSDNIIPTETTGTATLLKVSTFAVAGLIIIAVAVRTTLYPLSGYDTFFRWEALARTMLSHQSLHYYPPVTAEDFSIYFFTDGIPPLVSTVYWWLYAVMGKPVEQVTSVSVVLQLISTMALTFYATRYKFNTRAAFFSIVVLATSTLFIDGYAMGQESGFLALSVAGQLCFTLAAVRNPKSSLVAAAALFAALGCLSRDYGPALALSGFTVLACYPATRRFLFLFSIITAALSAPWYVRSWSITGNPLYSHPIPGGFKTNLVHTAMVTSYKELYSFSQLDISQWLNLFIVLITGATLALFLGVLHSILRWRESAPVTVSIGLISLLWVSSVPQTAGGLIYSMRVLTPAIVALSILAGAACSEYIFVYVRSGNRALRAITLVIIVSCTAYSLVFAASHPLNPKDLFSAITSKHTGPPPFCSQLEELVDRMESTGMPPTGVLTDDHYLANIMQRNSKFRPVMVWSPNVQFVFDPNINIAEKRRRLLAQNITLITFGNGPNNLFFSRIQFYREDMVNWKPLITIADKIVLFALPQP